MRRGQGEDGRGRAWVGIYERRAKRKKKELQPCTVLYLAVLHTYSTRKKTAQTNQTTYSTVRAARRYQYQLMEYLPSDYLGTLACRPRILAFPSGEGLVSCVSTGAEATQAPNKAVRVSLTLSEVRFCLCFASLRLDVRLDVRLDERRDWRLAAAAPGSCPPHTHIHTHPQTAAPQRTSTLCACKLPPVGVVCQSVPFPCSLSLSLSLQSFKNPTSLCLLHPMIYLPQLPQDVNPTYT